jgi:hypothetical protein
MRRILYLFLILTSSAYSQEIKIGTVFIIEFNNPENKTVFNVISQRPYQGIIDNSKIDSTVFHNKPTEKQITGVFAKGKFGDKISTMLVLMSGSNDDLDYELKIKIPLSAEFQSTSTSALFKGVKSIEYWPYDIEEINFKAFNMILKEKPQPFSTAQKLDSACLKTTAENIKTGEQAFKSYLKYIVLKFESRKKFKINNLLEYEKSINSEDVSLGHFWSLGESIYPNKQRFRFGNPLSFRRVECSYFEGTMDYFYTKAKREVKVISYDSKTFKKSNFASNKETEKNIYQKFIDKYNFLVGSVSDLLGKPLTIKQEENSGRIDTEWRSKNGIHAYLFRFTTYNEIRLYIYKE